MPGTVLARNLAALSPGPSRFGGMIAGNPALAILVHAWLPQEYSRLLGAIAHEATEAVARDAGPEFEKVHRRLFEILEGLLKAGELDAALAARTHGIGRPEMLLGLKVPDGVALDNLFQDLVKSDVPPEYRPLFKRISDNIRDPRTNQNVSVHQFDMDALSKKMQQSGPWIGADPVLYGFSSDAVWATSGANGRDAIRAALQELARPTPIFHFELNVKALSGMVSVLSPEVARLDDVPRRPDRRASRAGAPNTRGQ